MPRKKDFSDTIVSEDCTFLFTYDTVPCFLLNTLNPETDSSIVIKELSFFRTTQQPELAWVAMAGSHLRSWYVQNKYCGTCGSPTVHKTDERALMCTSCNNVIYPKNSPAKIVAITCNDKILLARGSHSPVAWYSLIAGYVDIGETLEETVRREVREEVGIQVTDIRYYTSHPWPLSGSMMIGFTAHADDSQPITLDGKEIAEAKWFTRGNLPNRSLSLSIAGEMIDNFENNLL